MAATNGIIANGNGAATIAPTLLLALPPPPADWDRERGSTRAHHHIHPTRRGRIEPVGEEFLSVVRRHRFGRSLAQDWELEAALRDAQAADVDLDDDEEETPQLLASNPDDWKEQDHYKILGISKLRWKANDEDLKRAYRRKVLKHHPDKKAGSTGDTNDDAFFKCIQKAWEVLSDPVRRRQWDSVDPEFDESIPGPKLKGDFFATFGPAFEKEARFCKNPETLSPFGDKDATKDGVEAFYRGWFNFESWRTFELLDEDEEGLGDSRDEKRYLDKKNRAARAKLKKEDNARINRLVETAFKLDPRIARIKEEEKNAKDAKKREKEKAARAAAEEAEKKLEEERLQKEQEEKEEKERREQERKEKEANKKLIRKAKKEIKAIFSANSNFLPASATIPELESQISKFEAIMENSELWHLDEFKFRLEQANSGGITALKGCFDDEYEQMKSRKEGLAARSGTPVGSGSATPTLKKAKLPWTAKEVTTLVKAVKSLPGGTAGRWEKIAAYVNLHGGEDGGPAPDRGPEECIKKSRELQDASVTERNAMQAAAAAAAKKKDVEIKEVPSSRADTDGRTPGTSTASNPSSSAQRDTASPEPPGSFIVPSGDLSWSPAQQAALEAGLRKYPASQFAANPASRWDKIAAEIEGKSKKEVKQRVKELAEAVKTKNKAKK